MNIGIAIQFVGITLLIIDVFQPGLGSMFYIGAIMAIPPWGTYIEKWKSKE